MIDSGTVTQHLLDHRRGDEEALDRLFPLIYDELRRIAHRILRGERASHTLSTTALVHECYINMADRSVCTFNDRAHFLAVAARAMRHLLIDHARRRNAQKRGGVQHRVTLDDRMISVEEQASDLIAVHHALDRLSERSPRMGKVVECRFFGGLTIEETAEAVGTSKRTVQRDWLRARAYLHHLLHSEAPSA